MQRWKTRAGLAGVALLFIATAMLFVPNLGIEADEALIGDGIYESGAPWYSWTFGGYEIPVMLISYLGALKTWLYNAVFAIWAPGPFSLRLPMMPVAAATILLFFALLDRAAGRRAAWIGTVLLATDTSFVLLEMSDFGPCVIQLFLKLAALLLLLRFHREGSPRALAGSFFLFGLALWDKAVFLWVLFGLVVACLLVFPRELRQRLSRRNVAVASAAMIIGALPLVIYNIARPFETLRANVKVERQPMGAKVEILKQTLNGHVLFGFLTAEDPGPHPGQPEGWYQRGSLWLGSAIPYTRHNLTLWAFLAAALSLVPLWRTKLRRPMLFGLVVFFAAWLPMVLTAGAGAASQHAILLWPFQFLVIAAALSSVSTRVAAALTVLLCASNLAVTNQYYADLIRNGGAIRWTDAIYTLDEYLAKLHAPRIFIADWGILETINLLSEGETPVIGFAADDVKTIERMLSNPRHIFVAHTAPHAVLPQLRGALEDQARRQGYREVLIRSIQDRNGRSIFEIFRFRKVHL
jgi:4-amino-4-deoxy-L-arabinose transferase-like glycosyltransferase